MAGSLDIQVAQGSRLDRHIAVLTKSTGQEWNFAGKEPKAQVRNLPGTPVLLDCNPNNGMLVVGTPSTRLHWVVPGEETALIPVGEHTFDLWVDDLQLVAGTFLVTPRVTV